MDPLMVPPSIVLASVFKGSDSQFAKKIFAEYIACSSGLTTC